MPSLITVVAAGSVLLCLTAASALTPPVVPLTVRNPYLSTWLGDARLNPWNKWPMFWTGEEVCLLMSKTEHHPGHGHTSLLTIADIFGYRSVLAFWQLFRTAALYILC